MRTLIEGGWVVAFNGKNHEVHEQGSVVFEDDRIVHAGGAYPGAVDARLSAKGKLVSPGFINTQPRWPPASSCVVTTSGDWRRAPRPISC